MADGQHKAKLRAILRSSLASKRGADELLDAVIALQSQVNELLIKLDADTGVTDTNYAATLSTSSIDD